MVMVLAPCEKSPEVRSTTRRAQHAAVVEAMVAEEALVFGGDEGFAHQHRDVVVGHRHAPLLADLGDQLRRCG